MKASSSNEKVSSNSRPISSEKASAGPSGIAAAPPVSQNRTGLPDNLKTGVESLSGLALDDVQVHYNSSRPAALQALAYTQGTDIHVAPGQERHLPHEAWHVVQQKQGRVKPTFQMKGSGINDDMSLEKEADQFGEKALQERRARPTPLLSGRNILSMSPVQRRVTWTETTVNNMDLVDTIMAGADFGFTAITVNGRDSDPNNLRPLNEPMLFWNRSRDGSQVEINIAEDADNALGTRMQLPTASPWERDVDKARVGGRLIGDARELGVEDEVMNYVFGVGQTRLRVKGNPNDGTLSRLTKTHEQHHVADDKAAKEAIVDPWNARIAQKMRTNAVTVGPNPTAALQQFYLEIGGTGAEIGKAYMDECARLGNDFHGTGPGGKPTLTSIGTTSDQSRIEATWKHPVEEGLLSRWFGV